MPIPSSETQLVQAEIKAELFRKAFMELAVEFARRDRKGFMGAGHAVRNALEQMDLKNFLPPAHVQGSTLDIELLRQSGLRDALASYDSAINQLVKRIR